MDGDEAGYCAVDLTMRPSVLAVLPRAVPIGRRLGRLSVSYVCKRGEPRYCALYTAMHPCRQLG